LVLHGWSKLTGFSQMSGEFPDPLGIGSPARALSFTPQLGTLVIPETQSEHVWLREQQTRKKSMP
jgi:hypothetical protein